MQNRTIQLSIIVLIVATFAFSVWAYPQLPQASAIHWDIHGTADGYGSPLFAAFFMPVLLLGLYVLFYFLPNLDPLRKNWEAFKLSYELFVASFIAVMAYIHVLTLLFNLGYAISIAQFLLPAIGLLFVVIGYIMPRTKRNWFLGIRTPWTLSSDTVWQKTHTLGGKLFVVAGVMTILSFLSTTMGFVFFMTGVMLAAIVPMIYSYWLYRQEENSQMTNKQVSKGQ